MTWYFPTYSWRGQWRGSNFNYIDAKVVAGEPNPKALPAPRPVMGRRARTLAEVWGIDPPRVPYAGAKMDHRK